MNRYTYRDQWSKAVYATSCDSDIREKLAQYEDTGLQPEEIAALLSLMPYERLMSIAAEYNEKV